MNRYWIPVTIVAFVLSGAPSYIHADYAPSSESTETQDAASPLSETFDPSEPTEDLNNPQEPQGSTIQHTPQETTEDQKDVKYVSELSPEEAQKKSGFNWANIGLAVGAIVVAVVALILVSKNHGKNS